MLYTAQHSSVYESSLGYLTEVKRIRAVGNTDPMNSFPHRKKGRPLLLGEKIDAMFQLFCEKKFVQLEDVCLAH